MKTGLRGFRLGLLLGDIADGVLPPTIVIVFDKGEQVTRRSVAIGGKCMLSVAQAQ
jgi:hypothetical protein